MVKLFRIPDQAFQADQEVETDLHHVVYRGKRNHYIPEMSAMTNAPTFADGPGILAPTETPRDSGDFDITLTCIFDGRVWKQGFDGGTQQYGGWELVKGREYALAYGGSNVLDISRYVPEFGDVISDLTAVTNVPSGVSGMGLLTDKEIPTSSGKHLRTLYALDIGKVFRNYYNGTSWGGWVSSLSLESGEVMTAYASADSGNIGTTPVVVPFNTTEYSRTGFNASLASSVVTVNENVPKLKVSYDVTSFVNAGVAAGIEHEVYHNGSAVARSASSFYASAVGIAAAGSARGFCVLDISSGDTIEVRSTSGNALSTFRTVGNACRLGLTRLAA